jgi:hypothetical protein
LKIKTKSELNILKKSLIKIPSPMLKSKKQKLRKKISNSFKIQKKLEKVKINTSSANQKKVMIPRKTL